ncbi:hypothetical protein H0N98_02375 [Candidatus Micrarchaeota archaeon]|nr:hypothetical protein [Candidatus Micrarchaeota archaeon]
MELRAGERIILKKSNFLNLGILGDVGVFTDTPLIGNHRNVNIFLTNQRVYTEVPLLRPPLQNIPLIEVPLRSIESVRREKGFLHDFLVVNYRHKSKISKVVLKLGRDTELWLKKIEEFKSKSVTKT